MASREHIGNSGALLECCCPKHSFPHLLRWRTSWWVLACPWCFRDFDTTLSSWFQKSWPLTNFITFCLWSSFGQKCLNSFCRSWSGHHLSAKAWLHHPVLWQEEALCHRSMLHPHYPFVKISFHNNACQIISSTSQGSRFVVLALGHLSLHHSLKCKTNLSQSLFVQLTKSMASALFVCILRNLLWSSFIHFSSSRLLTNAEGNWQSVLHLLGDFNIFLSLLIISTISMMTM